jgi:uncharacterized membrane protein
MNKHPIFLIIFGLSIFLTVSLFIAPMTLAPNTVSGLDGKANVMDFNELWDTLPPYQRAIYAFGDLNCHQKWYRSFTINGNQMPVDARMTSIFFFVNIGFLTMMFVEVDTSAGITILNIFPRRFRGFITKRVKPELFVTIVIILAILPVAIDGFTQLLTSYESTNFIRVLTGISTGWIGGVIFGAMILSVTDFIKLPRKAENIENEII